MKHKKTAAMMAAVIMSFNVFHEVLAIEQQPVFLTQSVTQSVEEYKLSKYDVINIVIVGFSDKYINSTYSLPDTDGSANKKTSSEQTTDGFNDIMLGPDGYVNLPYAGTVKLAGLTVAEATTVLTQKLGEYIKIPSMAVMIKQYGPRKVYVMGEVTQQGIYSLSSDYMNVFAALSSAGGIKKKGRPKHIALVRMVNGKVHLREINFDNFVKKQDSSQNVILQDGDMIYVPKSNKIDLQEDIMPIVSSVALVRSITN